MQPPDELMAGTFLPGMRPLVASRLRSRGLSQSRIATLLGVTQASVSIYLASDPGRAYALLSKLSVSRSRADRDSEELADALQRGPVDGVRALGRIWTGLLGSGAACREHREMYPSLAECDFCLLEYGARAGKIPEIVSEVARAVQLLEDSPHFVSVMPEVSVNLACAAEGASSPSEVVAIPGRIVRVKDRAKAMLPPEAGASAHMSKVLLLGMSRVPGHRACINIRYDSGVGKLLRSEGLRVLDLGRHSVGAPGDPTVDALERRLRSSTHPFDAVVEEGGSGIEPNVYLFAKSAMEVARMAVRLARAYSAA
jgi:predicted fused transcriptional regulator/phosphomethylpyrimidine kinase/predicted transcriptional regulator